MSTDTTFSTFTPPVVPSAGPTELPPEVLETAERLGVARYLPQVIDFTLEMFGSIARVFVMTDPEIPDDTHIMLEVHLHASIEESLDKDEEWGARLLQTIPRSPRVYCLSVDLV